MQEHPISHFKNRLRLLNYERSSVYQVLEIGSRADRTAATGQNIRYARQNHEIRIGSECTCAGYIDPESRTGVIFGDLYIVG